MLGNNQNEAGYYKVPAYGQGKILNQSVWDDFNLECFTCATALEAAQRVASGVPTWRYVHHGDWDNTRFVPILQHIHEEHTLTAFQTIPYQRRLPRRGLTHDLRRLSRCQRPP